MFSPSALGLDLGSLRNAYRTGALTPTLLIEEILRRVETYGDPALFIHLLPRPALLAYAARLETSTPDSLPLFGVPFAIKDNIDLAGVPTTAACPEFAYTPETSATVVARLIAAGAIPIGKTNLDQFATGLVGVRSPYGVPRNPFHPEMIPGGSSSGSASAVAAGLVSFSLGTDTAGSGRVPASFQNLVGVKPTRGWLSTRGVVPACRSLDCVSVFALTVDDAVTVTRAASAFDSADAFSRSKPPQNPPAIANEFRFGVPCAYQLEWFGDPHNPTLFAAAIRQLESLGGKRVEIDFTPFRDAARLLYDGPWVAERWSAIRGFHQQHAEALFPVTRKIIEGGAKPLAVDLFEAWYQLAALRRSADATWETVDTLVLPTAASIYTQAQLAADPITLNSRLGYYTNFANLLDTAAIAVPAGIRADGLPFGITFFGPAWTDDRLAELGARFHHATGKTLGATGSALPPRETATSGAPATEELQLAVVGAHLTGQPLNRELSERGGRLVKSTHTAACYRFYALKGTTPPKPGLARVAPETGARIEVEVWSLPPAAWASFVASIPPPLGIGTLLLSDGSSVKGFIAESAAFDGATDISEFGGWRNYLKSRAPKP
ncbi:MAG: allophanate hydrolase [Opitutus sp.]